MAPNRTHVREYAEHKSPSSPSPSASIILISPSNKILLLHRVQTSSAFPSAHVFPGGNLEQTDGELPSDPKDVARHKDNLAYRTGAIRELFEESGILLARRSADSKQLLEVSASNRREGRKAIHAGKIRLDEWISNQSTDAKLDTDSLIPFTHWVTPPNVPKRFTTQMYVYFVPFEEEGNASVKATSDQVETMSPEWKTAKEWIKRAQDGDVILFPPQFLLLSLVSMHLDQDGSGHPEASDKNVLEQRREDLRRFIETDGQPPWRDKFISPIGLQFGLPDGKAVLGLDKVGPELKDSGLQGDYTRVILVKFQKDGPRQLEVRWRKEVMEESRQWKEKNSKL